LASDETVKELHALLPRHEYLQWVQIWRVSWPFFFLIIFRQFACRRCWATEPRASRWIRRSVRQADGFSLQ